MRIAVYPSVLYGADFIRESILSVLPYVDHVYVVLMSRPWGGTDGVRFRGEWVAWPERFDNTRQILTGMKSERLAWISIYRPPVEIIDAYSHSPWDRWAFGVNLARQRCTPDEVVVLDPDCVFSTEEAARTFADWDAHPEYTWAQPSQVELWKTLDWQIVRPRCMVTFHRGDLDLISGKVRQERGIEAPQTHRLDGTVHNLGFACSEATTRWKHLTSLAFSPVIGETAPNENWLDEKWIRWTPETRDLEPAAGLEHLIRCAVPYTGKVPESVRARFSDSL